MQDTDKKEFEKKQQGQQQPGQQNQQDNRGNEQGTHGTMPKRGEEQGQVKHSDQGHRSHDQAKDQSKPDQGKGDKNKDKEFETTKR
jgi:hypothetical protein